MWKLLSARMSDDIKLQTEQTIEKFLLFIHFPPGKQNTKSNLLRETSIEVVGQSIFSIIISVFSTKKTQIFVRSMHSSRHL